MKQPLRYIRFWTLLAILVVGTPALTPAMGWAPALLIAFDVGALVFIVWTLWMMRASDPDDMRKRAEQNDPDHHVLLLLAGIVVAVVLVAVWVELTSSDGRKELALALAGITLLFAWLFSNILIAVHYAALYYAPDEQRHDRGGLKFPNEPMPDYVDFTYYAFVLGMTFQVSDVQITSRRMRRMALCHGLAAFLFNIVVVALSVSLIGGLLR